MALKLDVGQKIVTVGDPIATAGAMVDSGVIGVITARKMGYYTVTFDHNIYDGEDTGEDFWSLDDEEVVAVKD